MGFLESIGKFLGSEPANKPSPLYKPRYVNTNVDSQATLEPVMPEPRSIEGLEGEELNITLLHDEFDMAPAKLLAEARAIVARNSKVIVDPKIMEKADRLSKLGFKNTPESKAAEETKKALKLEEEIKEMGKRTAETVLYYHKKYPFQKFLTVDELHRICRDYGLIYAPVSTYAMQVPDKNLTEIENGKPVEFSDLPDDILVKDNRYGHFFNNQDLTSILSSQGKTSYEYGRNPDLVRLCEDLNKDRSRYSDGHFQLSSKAYFQIAAPIDHFDQHELSKFNKINSFGYATREVRKDPVVFRFVKNGVLVYSKWGIEANHPLLTNPIEN